MKKARHRAVGSWDGESLANNPRILTPGNCHMPRKSSVELVFGERSCASYGVV